MTRTDSERSPRERETATPRTARSSGNGNKKTKGGHDRSNSPPKQERDHARESSAKPPAAGEALSPRKISACRFDVWVYIYRTPGMLNMPMVELRLRPIAVTLGSRFVGPAVRGSCVVPLLPLSAVIIERVTTPCCSVAWLPVMALCLSFCDRGGGGGWRRGSG